MNRSRFTYHLLVVLAVLLATGCASYEAVRQPSLVYDNEAQQRKVQQEGIEVVAKPIYLKADLMKYFDQDLLELWILPVQIWVSNKTGNSIYFATEGISLSDSSDKACALLTCETVVDKISKSQWRTVGWAAAFGVFGLVPSLLNVSDTNKRIRSDYESRTLKSGTVTDSAVTEGLAFFQMPPNITSLDGVKLKLAFKNLKTDAQVVAETELRGTLEPRPLRQEEPSQNQ